MYAILLMKFQEDWGELLDVEDCFECVGGNIVTFKELDAASEYQEKKQLDGKVVELPIY